MYAIYVFCVFSGCTQLGSEAAVIDRSNSFRNTLASSKVALCVAGGLRDARPCVRSIESSIFGQKLAKLPTYIASWFNQPATFSTYVATWQDFEAGCATDNPSDLKRMLQEDIYGSSFNVKGTWTSAHSKLDTSALRRLSPGIYKKKFNHTGNIQHPPPRWFHRPYHQYALWENCLNLVEDADVIVKVRPDVKFRSSAQFLWRGRDASTSATKLSFMGQDLKLSENRIFVLESDINPGFVDDALVFGSRTAMNRAVRDFKASIEAGVFQVNDAVYNASYGDEAQFKGPVLPQDAPWRELVPERLFLHHMKRMGLDIIVLSPRGDVLELNTCSCGKGEYGRASCCH